MKFIFMFKETRVPGGSFLGPVSFFHFSLTAFHLHVAKITIFLAFTRQLSFRLSETLPSMKLLLLTSGGRLYDMVIFMKKLNLQNIDYYIISQIYISNL